MLERYNPPIKSNLQLWSNLQNKLQKNPKKKSIEATSKINK